MTEVAQTSSPSSSRRTAAIIRKEEVKLGRKIGGGAHGTVHEGTWADAHGAVSSESGDSTADKVFFFSGLRGESIACTGILISGGVGYVCMSVRSTLGGFEYIAAV